MELGKRNLKNYMEDLEKELKRNNEDFKLKIWKDR